MRRGFKCLIFLICAATSLPLAAQNTATVHFYRYKQYDGAALNPSVYCDGVEVTRIPNGRFFTTQVPAGVHTFTSNDKQAGAQLTLEAGKDYYFRVDLQAGFWKGHFRLDMVPIEQGKFDESRLKHAD